MGVRRWDHESDFSDPLWNEWISWSATKVILNHKLKIGDCHSQRSIGLGVEEWFVHVVIEIVNVLIMTDAISEGVNDTIEGRQK